MRIEAIANTTTTAKPDQKLVDGARSFEAMMLGEMLKPLNFGGSPDDGADADAGAAGTIRSLGTEAVAKAISTAGGFGLARQIIRQVDAEHEVAETKKEGTKVL